MKGYFVSTDQAIKLGLSDDLLAKMQKTVIVITQNDIINHSEKKLPNQDVFFDELADWFYRQYFDGMMVSFSKELRMLKL